MQPQSSSEIPSNLAHMVIGVMDVEIVHKTWKLNSSTLHLVSCAVIRISSLEERSSAFSYLWSGQTGKPKSVVAIARFKDHAVLTADGLSLMTGSTVV